MIELENAQIESDEELGPSYAKYEASPLPAGYGVTLGNALRRVMLSSLEGAAVTSIQVRDVYHEFSSIPGVKEDLTQIVLNVKKLRLKSYAPHPVQLKLVKSGAGVVTAADITENPDVEIVNPEQHLMVLDSGDVTIEVDLTVERGVGYLAAERAEPLPIGVIPIDAIFTPVRKVNYTVENTRVGQMTNYDKLTIEIETDGTITPEEALSRAAEILVGQFSLFTRAGKPLPIERNAAGGPAIPANMLDMPIEDLDLPMRAYNSLKRNNIVKVGQLLQLGDDVLLRMRNFGK
jgi:DNA-directed RNA polymerase subunit alpha